MTQIHKFSLVYDPNEDRLAWDGEDTQGATTRLWLTQRLCRGLVNALVPMLKTAAPQAVALRHPASVQSWEQAAAMADFGKVPGVQPQPQATVGLVRAVHIQPTNDIISLTFDFGAGDARTIGASQLAIRQMLAVMYRLHVAAGWPLDVWPAWIAEPAAPVPDDAVN